MSSSTMVAAVEPEQQPDQPSLTTERLRRCGLLPWLEQAVRHDASDLFLSVGDKPILEIHGSFRPLGNAPLTSGRLAEIVEVLLPEAKRAQFLEGREVDVGLGVEGLTRFRVNIFREQDGHAIVAQRLLRRKDGAGMVAATEVLIATLAVRNIIRQNRLQELRSYMEIGERTGMHTLDNSIQALMKQGLVGDDAFQETCGVAQSTSKEARR